MSGRAARARAAAAKLRVERARPAGARAAARGRAAAPKYTEGFESPVSRARVSEVRSNVGKAGECRVFDSKLVAILARGGTGKPSVCVSERCVRHR